ncbi:MAG: hypothetical protein Q9171_003167 [Xanthocarpia ochracea]
MAALAAGYAHLEGTIPPDLIQLAADAISSGKLRTTIHTLKHHEFEVPNVCYSICDYFMATFNLEPIKALLHYLPADTLPQPLRPFRIGQFQETTGPSPGEAFSERTTHVYVTIAITDLKPVNGAYIFLEGSHRLQDPKAKTRCDVAPMRLLAGRAEAWCGNLSYTYLTGGGGSFITLVFEKPI